MRIYKSYSDKEIEILKRLYPNTPNVCISSLLGATYGSVRRAAIKHGLKKTNGYLSKQSKKHGFKKDHIPKSAKANGYEALNSKGYLKIKVKSKRKITLKHHYIYEQHFGKIPKGSVIFFKDKNPLNCDIENLECLTRSDIMKRNSIINYPKNLVKAIYKHSKLKRLINAKSEQLRQTK
jgi:hypothetical protein